MKKVIPFTKTIQFKTLIGEITDIEIKHNLLLKDNDEVEGDILIDGKYKMTNASINQEEFHYKLPFMITIDEKYDTSNLDISIGDFNYEIIDEEKLKVDIEIDLDNLEEKEETRNNEIKIPFEIDEQKEKIEIEEDNLEEELNNENKSISSIFSSITSNEETFSTYHVYIISDDDTLESIMEKYNVSREELSDYNDLDSLELGTKLIIPCSND